MARSTHSRSTIVGAGFANTDMDGSAIARLEAVYITIGTPRGDKDVAQALRRLIAESEVNDRAIERLSVHEKEGFVNGPGDLHCRTRIFECRGDVHHADDRACEIWVSHFACLGVAKRKYLRRRRLLGEP